MDQLKAALKFLASFLKTTWDIEDYPVRLKHQEGGDLGRLKTVPWSAQIVNWWQMAGSGQSSEEAYADLGRKLAARRAAGKLPRPGRRVPLEFAAGDELRRHERLARDFCQRVLGLSYDDCFLSDESSLWDFHADETNDFLIQRIRDLYGVDVSDVEKGKLVRIFERLDKSGRA